MDILRLPLLLATAVSVDKAMTPPTSQAPPSERIPVKNAWERFMWKVDFGGKETCKVAAWLPAAVETCCIIYQYGWLPREAQSWLARILAQFDTPGRSGYTSNLSPALIAGAVIAVYGSYFRSSAYRALGRHFTFHLALKTDHTLIREWPYSVVRHPSYTGFYLVTLGYVITTLAPDSWIRNIAWSQLIRRPGAWLTGFILARTAVHYALILKVFYDRTSEEDALLKRKFGKQWDAWAEEVPYMLMPGLY